MVNGFHSVMREAERKLLHPRLAAYTLAIARVAEALELRGVYP
jgi:glutamate dehydrogenase/leucine dehydrogenase